MDQEKKPNLHVSVEEMAAYQAGYKPNQDGTPFDPKKDIQHLLNPQRRDLDRKIRREMGTKAKSATKVVLDKIKNKK